MSLAYKIIHGLDPYLDILTKNMKSEKKKSRNFSKIKIKTSINMSYTNTVEL